MALTSERISLRALESSDVELLYKWENDVAIWRVSNTRTPFSKYILASYIKSSDKDIWESKELRLVIENQEQKPIGTIELFDFDPYHNRAGLGIVIFEKSDRRKGLATEALQLIMDYALNELGVFQLYVNVAGSNRASLLLFEKLGFQLSGVKKRWLRIPSGWEDEYLLQKFL
jgi:diamine N-acetyltransferase